MDKMQMLIKFETKSSRVKGVSFHPKRPWILASLHNGSIQLWDYRMGILLEKFEEHDGPVRGISFHPSRDLFVSGGDDYKIRVWSYKTRRCLFTLQGHLDYVRTVYFHPEQPWIISASDDQTIRIWNWQSKQCIAVLTGHNHYVMCAQFHPKEDLVVSACLDQTVRVWDISGLRKKNAAGSGPPMPDMIGTKGMNLGMNSQQDMFGLSDVIVKFVLEGHMRGVNWCAFHPDKPLILSAGDDRQIKIWRMSDNKAWELDACRGHYNNVSSAVFHSGRDFIISDSEDKSIRVWDANKRTLIQTFRREQDRFWCLASHPEINLFAAGHDGGLIVFKLERERPAYSIYQNSLIHVAGSELRLHDYNTDTTTSLIKIRSSTPGKYVPPPRSLSFNPAEKLVLINTDIEGGTYELHSLAGNTPAGQARAGAGSSAVWISRNRFAVLEKATQTIHIRDPTNVTTKTIKAPVSVNEMFLAPGGNLILSSPNSVLLFDVQSRAIIAELSVPGVKYVSWSVDMTKVALLSKHTITIASNNFKQLAQVSETIRIKSAAWDEQNVLLYTTLNHLKYALTQGDNGIICTLDDPHYLTKVRGSTAYCIDRNAENYSLNIDPTEYRFKLALVQRNYEQVVSIIKNSNLVGQSIIAYLQKKGYPEIALHFVRDNVTRFGLALECGDMNIALETAKAIDKPQYWLKLSQESLRLGHIQVADQAYQRMKDMNKLSFLYSITGATDKQQRLGKTLSLSDNFTQRFQHSLYAGNPEDRIRIFEESGQLPLAYLTAKSHGFEEKAKAILAAAEIDESEISGLSTDGSLLVPPAPLISAPELDWPRLDVSKNMLDKKLFSSSNKPHEPAQTQPEEDNGLPNGASLNEAKEDLADSAAEPTGSGWGMDEELDIEDEIVAAEAAAVDKGISGALVAPESDPDDLTILGRKAKSPIDFVLVGDFEKGMKSLKTKYGITSFEPLKPLFLEIYSSSRTVLSTFPGVPPTRIPLFKPSQDGSGSTGLTVPVALCKVQTAARKIQDNHQLFTEGKFSLANEQFRKTLQSMVLVVANDEVEEEQRASMIKEAREYILGTSLELKRRDIAVQSPSEAAKKQQIELAAYFTKCEMKDTHTQLALRSAMTVSFKAQCFRTAGDFARRLLELDPPEGVAQKAKQLQAVCDRQSRNAIDIDYNEFTPFVICAASLTPIYQGEPSVECAYCQASYKPTYAQSICEICKIARIGTV
ncbi:hypothetical protein H4219_001712 [Mycoemilia scoparia]|uniref:Coatomer subunit alpha n=1 Tax=Mycoemilia scoparia TaxID=417184 RepID=A0A9W8DUZ3_9FUNG|nr:hypothetical protein H4219_001712 [Mycoemilia scoparia]